MNVILITQSEVVNYKQYSKLPIDRIELFSDLIYLRMIRFKDQMLSHLDLINILKHGNSYADANYSLRRDLLNIWNLPSFNSIHLATYLKQYDISCDIINNFDSEWDQFCNAYDRAIEKPLVAISTTFYLNQAEIKRLSKCLRAHDPKMKLAIGGAYANSLFKEKDKSDIESVIRNCKINYVIHSHNSEKDFLDLISLSQKKKLSDVKNLAYIEGDDFKNDKIIFNEVEWNAPVLDLKYQNKQQFHFLNNTIQLRSSSGCPFSCAFCSYPTTTKGFHLMDLSAFDDMISFVTKELNITNIIFIDDTINIPVKRFKEICKILAKYNLSWFSFLRVQFIDKEIADLMKASGCKAVYLGIESSNNKILKNMNKKATKEEFLKGIEILNEKGIYSVGAFVLGFPGETEDTIIENINFIETSGLDFYTLKEFYLVPETPIDLNREHYKLEGYGNDWKHETMSSNIATAYKLRMFHEIKNSVYIDSDLSLWYIASLFNHGYKLPTILKIQKRINRIMQSQIAGTYDDKDPLFMELKNLV